MSTAQEPLGGPSVAFDLFPGSTPQLPSEEDFGEFSSFEKEEPPEFCLGIPRRERGWLIRHFLANQTKSVRQVLLGVKCPVAPPLRLAFVGYQ